MIFNILPTSQTYTVFFISSNLGSIYSSATSRYNLSSYHSPALLTLHFHPILSPRLRTLTSGPTNWNKYQDSLDSRIDLNVSLKTLSDIDCSIQIFSEVSQQIGWESSELHHSRPRSSLPLCIPQHIYKQNIQIIYPTKARQTLGSAFKKISTI